MRAIITQRFHFDSAHYLPGHPKCGTTHGHRFRIEIAVSGCIQANGMVIDFADLKAAVQPLIDKFDHSFLNDFLEIPTAENIGRFLWDNITLPAGIRKKLEFIRVWETPNSYAEVRG